MLPGAMGIFKIIIITTLILSIVNGGIRMFSKKASWSESTCTALSFIALVGAAWI